MILYQLPYGIRIPREDEYHTTDESMAMNESRNRANIGEGYKTMSVSGQKYTHYMLINADADKLWDVFVRLSKKLFSDKAYAIFGMKDEKPELSRHLPISRVLSVFEQYSYELSNDGYLQFGIASANEVSFNEVFVSSFKYLKIWTNKVDEVIQILHENHIYELEDLSTIDQFAVVSEALRPDVRKGINHYSAVLDNIHRQMRERPKM